MRASRIRPVTPVLVLFAAGGLVHASQPFPPKLIHYDELPDQASQAVPGDATGVVFDIDIDDPGGTYADYYADVESHIQFAVADWSQHLDGDATIRLRVYFDDGDGSYLMAAGPILVQTGEIREGKEVWQAATIWKIRGMPDPNGASADAELVISPAFIDQMWWGYPAASPGNKYDAYTTLLHELGHVFGFIHIEDFYTGGQTWGTSYDFQTVPLAVGHAYDGNLTTEAFGGQVPLADTEFDADRSHVGISTGEGSLMYPFATPGQRLGVTGIELGMLGDAGMPIDAGCVDPTAGEDTDGDGVSDCADNCASAANATQVDSDGDGFGDACDLCPQNAAKATDVGSCGCNDTETDSDADGVPDCIDECPADPTRSIAGICGCEGVDDGTDTDGDGVPDCDDGCPNDPGKTELGRCGCAVPETDTDADGTPDCVDDCLNDGGKVEPGVCGCGVVDEDFDFDGTMDCLDGCPADENKTDPGTCGCGTPDSDRDLDGVPDCVDDDTDPNDEFLTIGDEDGSGGAGGGVAGGTCGSGMGLLAPLGMILFFRLIPARRHAWHAWRG